MEIEPYVPQILNAIEIDPIVSVSAPTGSGKSLGIPKGAAESGFRIFVGVPTIVAARSLMQQQQRISPHIAVGFGAEGEKKYNDETMIIYATHGHLRNYLLTRIKEGRCDDLEEMDVLMVDEAHTGTTDITLILALWVYCASTAAAVPRLLISSATLEGMNLSPIKGYKVINISFDIRRFSIQIRNHPSTPTMDSNQLYTQTAQVVQDLYNSTPNGGHILVFVPGSAEAEMLANMLYEGDYAVKGALILPAYSALGSDQLNLILEPSQERKIVITTNVMESALTLPDVEVIVDTMLEKIPETSDSGGLRLVTDYESQASAKQRAGRTGRTMAGICYRMMTLRDFEKLRKIRVEEVERVPIHSEVISLISSGLNPAELLSSVSSEKINDTINLLQSQGLVTQGNEVTDAGQFVTKVPLGVKTGNFLYKWIQQGNAEFPGIVIAAVIDSFGPSYFYFPRKQRGETQIDYEIRISDQQQLLEEFGGPDPLESYLQMAITALNYLQTLTPRRAQVVQWAQNNSINARKLRELISIVNRTSQLVGRLFKTQVQIGNFSWENALDRALPLLQEVYSEQIMTRLKGNRYKSESGVTYSIRGTNVWKTTAIPEKVLALVTSESGKEGQTFRVITLYTALTADTTKPDQELLDLIEGL